MGKLENILLDMGFRGQEDRSRSPASPGRVTKIPVRIPGSVTQHDILVGTGVLGELKNYLGRLKLSRDVLIISSPTINDLYGAKVDATLKAAGCWVTYALFPDGEEHKTIDTWLDLLNTVNRIEEKNGTRLLVVCLGGGVVGDVGAFVAACYGRGRDYIQLPTTLLGQVDCGIGGKCAVNFKGQNLKGEGKNLIGVFHQPRLVLADLSFLKTLPIEQIRSGLAEVIKYGVIVDAALLDTVEENLERILECDLQVLEPIVTRCFALKVDFVQRDEKDNKGIRAMLNFGHTVGHALETATNYDRYSHGEAISVGMLCACEIAEKLHLINSGLRKRLEILFQRAGLPTMMSADVDGVMNAMGHDKKFSGGVNKFVLPTRVGHVELVENIDIGLIREVVTGRVQASSPDGA